MSVLYRRPTSIEDAVAELDDDDALPLAGGVSVVLLMNTGLLAPRKLVSLGSLPGLRGVRVVDDHIEIGALTTHAALATDPVLLDAVACAAEAFGRIGNVRVRAWGTIGGNLAHADPAQDPPVLLAALGATVVVVGPGGERTIPVANLADGPFSTVLSHDELITTVLVPSPPPGTRTSYVKLLPRTQDDYATVSAAANLDFAADGTVRAARLVFGAVGPVPIVADAAAALLVGQRADDGDVLASVAASISDAVRPIGDGRGSADYKRQMAGVVARRAVLACVDGGS